MTALAIVVGVLIVWFAIATPPALLIGRAIRLRDKQAPAPTTAVQSGEATTRRRGAHLWLVR